jgi:hypothetical protein
MEDRVHEVGSALWIGYQYADLTFWSISSLTFDWLRKKEVMSYSGYLLIQLSLGNDFREILENEGSSRKVRKLRKDMGNIDATTSTANGDPLSSLTPSSSLDVS